MSLSCQNVMFLLEFSLQTVIMIVHFPESDRFKILMVCFLFIGYFKCEEYNNEQHNLQEKKIQITEQLTFCYATNHQTFNQAF